MYCEKCKKEIKKEIEVRWLDFKEPFSYFHKRFNSFDDLVEWLEKTNHTDVVLKVIPVNGGKKNGR